MDYAIFSRLNKLTSDIMELIAILPAATPDEYIAIEKSIFSMESEFCETARKAAGELSSAIFKSKTETENEIRSKTEGRYFKYGECDYFRVNKIGRVEYDAGNLNSQVWLKDCTVTGVWRPLSRTEYIVTVGSKLHTDIAYKFLEEITEDEYKSAKAELMTAYGAND